MKSEIELFLKGIKPAIYISEKQYMKNKELFNGFKIIKNHKTNSYLIYRGDEIKELKIKEIGNILGYPPFCVQRFEECRNEPKKDNYQQHFINFGGIVFNCFDKKEESLEWCNETYTEAFLKEWDSFDIIYTQVNFTKNYLGGYTREVITTEEIKVNSYKQLKNK